MRLSLNVLGHRILRPAVLDEYAAQLEWWSMSADEVIARQEAKLRNVLGQALARPEYARYVADYLEGDPRSRVRGIEDLRILPPVEKPLLAAMERNVGSQGRGVLRNSTSGSSGRNFKFLQDEAMRSASSAAARHAYRRIGVEYWADARVLIWGRSPRGSIQAALRDKMQSYLLNVDRRQIYGMDQSLAEKYLREIAAMRPAVLEGYPSYLEYMARVGMRGGIERPAVEHVVASGEQVTDAARELIESYFERSVEARYGSREFGVIAHQEGSDRTYYVHPSRVVLEEDRNELLVTDLDNCVSAFIRYRIGDVGRTVGHGGLSGFGGQGLCDLEGRSHDWIETRTGKAIPGQYWTLFSRVVQGIDEFQLWQGRDRSIEFRFTTTSRDGSEIAAELETRVMAQYGDEVEFRAVVVDEIERTRLGKRRFVIKESEA